MGDTHSIEALELQASALAEKTARMALEDLAQLCPEAERIIEDLLALKPPSSQVLHTLGLHTERELRVFVERVILKVATSPQDVLAEYLYQGKAARKAGLSPRRWIFLAHRPLRVAMMRIFRAHQLGEEFPASVASAYGLHYPEIRQAVEQLLHSGAQTSPAADDALEVQVAQRLSLVPQLEYLLRKGAALGLMQKELQQQKTRSKPPADRDAPMTARIPMSAVLMRQAAKL